MAPNLDGQRVECLNFTSRFGGNPSCVSNACKTSDNRIYKAKLGSTYSLGQGEPEEIFRRMQANVYAGGPIVGGMFVHQDFMLSALKSWGWGATNGIYIHASPSPYCNDAFITGVLSKVNSGASLTSDETRAASFAQMAKGDTVASMSSRLNDILQTKSGGHAVAIVGWGVGDTKHPKYGMVRYWIVRNSWGEAWNEQGYFRIAFTDVAKGINDKVGFDYPKAMGGGLLAGGATVFQVSDEYHPHGPVNPSRPPGSHSVSPGGPSVSPGSNSTNHKYMMIAAGSSILSLFVFWLCYKMATVRSRR